MRHAARRGTPFVQLRVTINKTIDPQKPWFATITASLEDPESFGGWSGGGTCDMHSKNFKNRQQIRGWLMQQHRAYAIALALAGEDEWVRFLSDHIQEQLAEMAEELCPATTPSV